MLNTSHIATKTLLKRLSRRLCLYYCPSMFYIRQPDLRCPHRSPTVTSAVSTGPPEALLGR